MTEMGTNRFYSYRFMERGVLYLISRPTKTWRAWATHAFVVLRNKLNCWIWMSLMLCRTNETKTENSASNVRIEQRIEIYFNHFRTYHNSQPKLLQLNRPFKFKLIACFFFPFFFNQSGERCYTPDDSFGICVLLPQCPSLVNFYGQYQNDRRAINYLLAAQRNCGVRSIRRNPIVCCSEPIINRPQRPDFTDLFTERPDSFTEIPMEVPTTIIEITEQPTTEITIFPTAPPPTPDPSSRLNNQPCIEPMGARGTCRNIKQCPAILNEFLARSKDNAYIQYLRESNKKCEGVQPFICCPFENRPSTNAANVNLQGRLLTPEEGCGSSNATVRKIVGGTTAKAGEFPWMTLIG